MSSGCARGWSARHDAATPFQPHRTRSSIPCGSECPLELSMGDDAAWTRAECNEAIEAYHALLRDDAGLAEESAAMLAEAQGPARVTFGGKPLCRVLRPHFL